MYYFGLPHSIFIVGFEVSLHMLSLYWLLIITKYIAFNIIVVIHVLSIKIYM